jgi:uncharacterized protein YhaN
MKIRELRLTAFGPFTGVNIDLSRGREGLHVVYGPNEAGKSSALRALRNLFYGIPLRSPDGFLHPYEKMRVGAVIQRKNGDVLEFVRRKGRTNTLRAADDKAVLAEEVVRKFVNGIDEDAFATMFGIDHADLVRGGREIIGGGGSLGQVIFAAGSGVVNLREIQQDLQAEAEDLFKPSGQKPRINEALGSFIKNRQELREAQLPGQLWTRHDQALRNAQARIRVVNQDLVDKQRGRHRLERIREALPLIARRRELLADKKVFADAVLLPDKFGEERRELATALSIAENEKRGAVKNIVALNSDLAGLEVAEGLLENAELIEAVHQELGSHRKAGRDRIQRETQKNVLRAEAGEILRSLRNDMDLADADQLRLRKPERLNIQQLGSQFERMATRSETARAAISQISLQIDEIDTRLVALDAPRSTSRLKIAADQAEAYGALEKTCREDQLEIQNDLKTLEINVGRQSLWSGTAADIEGLAVPATPTIDAFENRLAVADQAVSDRISAGRKLQADLAETRRQIEQLQLAGRVPSEQDLKDSRSSRTRGWLLVRAMLENHSVPAEEARQFIDRHQPAQTLADAYEASVSRSDEISDRLRREADRVAALANLLAAKSAFEQQAEALKNELELAEKNLAEISAEWQKQWQPAGITPRTPREMRGWAQDHLARADKAAEIRARKSRAEALQAVIAQHRRELVQCLQPWTEAPAGRDESLAEVVKRARQIIEYQQELSQSRKQLLAERAQREQELAAAADRVAQSEKELSGWQHQWEQAVAPLGLTADSKPFQANAVMEELQILFDKLKEADTLQKRIRGIDRDAAEFARNVAGLVQAMAPDLAGLPPDQAAMELNGRLSQARTNRTKMQAIAAQLEKENQAAARAENKIAAVQNRLDLMCREAGCENPAELAEAERRSEMRRRIDSDLAGLDEQLIKLTAGATIEYFVLGALKEDPDGIEPEIQRLNEEIDRLTDEKSRLDQTIGEERNELSKMDGGARAAELAEQAQMLLGRLENDTEQYARLRIASAVLHRAIERFREKNQGPILTRANAIFARLTCGSFEGIRADFDDQGRPVLVGVRPDGKDIVGVEGMSEGSADQLYLALRLAGLEDYLDKNEPIPFIVDDILIKFDDARAAAALRVLAQLAARTQILFFTHHRHLVELADKHVDPALLIKHTLNA